MTNPAAAQNQEIDCLSPEAQRLAEARLAAKRAARAEAREIRMKELERQQKEEDSERYSRRPRRNTSASDEDERMSVGSRGSLRHSEYSGHLNSGSRASSRPSSARASPVVEERPDKDFTEKGPRSMPSLSAATLASLGGTSSRRGSGDTSISIETEASMREIKELNELKDQIQDVEGKYMQGLKEMKDSLAEVEEKYKKAMVSNAQLDNEKTNLMYQVDSLKDTLLELEEQLAESRRQYEEKNKEFEREKHAHSVLQFQFAEAKEALKQREEMLEEIRQLQQKQASYIREISDLQETIEWKDKKIGALERQKEFFDSIRSERDDLREEVVMLKEELKKHGIILNSETATNGETSDTLNNVGYQGPIKMTKEELNALKSTGDGALGRANEVEVKNEMVENVGNTEQEQHTEDLEALHPGEKAEDRDASEAPSVGPLAAAQCEEQVQSQVLEGTERVDTVTDMPHDRTGVSLEQSDCASGLDGEVSGPEKGQDSYEAFELKKQSTKSVEKQKKEKEEFKTNLEEVNPEPGQGPVPLHTSEVERVSSADVEGLRGHPENAIVPGANKFGEQVGAVTPGPLNSDDTVSDDENCVVGAPKGLEPSSGHGSEKELANQEVAESQEAPVQSTEAGRENSEEDRETESRDEKPAKTEAQPVPGSPAARNADQGAAGPSVGEPESESSGGKELAGLKNDQQREAPDSAQRKAKNKRKKNKKKKPLAPAEPLEDVKKELTYQNSDLSEGKEEQVQFIDQKPVVEAQIEVTESPKQKMAAGSSADADCLEHPQTDLDEKLSRDGIKAKAGGVIADGGMLNSEDDTVESSGTDADNIELDQGFAKDNAKKDGTAQSHPPEPESQEVCSSTLLENKSPPEDIHDATQAGGTEGQVPAQHAGQSVKEVSDSISLEDDDDDMPAPAGELADTGAESREDDRESLEGSKGKEDCTLS
ncbi:leucine-rich repeat flightless-interacting protein 1 isoform X2 [Tupaia chinensis]|uniref:leucine-rich repeat flightless-interacting protein 1 isoform X2 n=1 Tax=Tupaia chinensis TaxID=246437 RepID=UPI000FFC8B78|nr:leucine-rich repeat flightless-interacting protein 1 isoform X2 [Tupaia chinensis]